MKSLDLYRVYHRILRTLSRTPAAKLDFHETYPRLVKTLKKHHQFDKAMKLAVGGEFEAFGILERELLIQQGLKQDGYLIDVGCGSGRLAKPLSQYLTGKYLGIDVVPELVEYARKLVPQPDWRFEVAEGLRIPEKNNQADMVCFFSIFTHLLHEQSYTYLQEAKRVLKSDGKIIFSFLEFSVPGHWPVFEATIGDMYIGAHPLNVFLSRDAIETWAAHLDLKVQFIQRGDEPHILLRQPVAFENGAVMEKQGQLGQSVCVLSLK